MGTKFSYQERKRLGAVVTVLAIAIATVAPPAGTAAGAFAPAPCTISAGSANVNIRDKRDTTTGKTVWTAPKYTIMASAKAALPGGSYRTPAGNSSNLWVYNVSYTKYRYAAYNWVVGPMLCKPS